MKIQSLAYNSDYDDPKKARKPGAVRPAPSPSGLSVGGGGTTGGGGMTINGTNGQLPYRVNSTTFGDSAIASNALNSTYLSVTSGASGAGLTLAPAGGGTNENLKIGGKGASGYIQALSRIIGDTTTPYLELSNGSGTILAYGSNTLFLGGSGLVANVASNAVGYFSASGLNLAANGVLSIAASGAAVLSADVYLRRNGAGNWAFGQTDGAVPVAQTLSVQNGTGTNTAGVTTTHIASLGTSQGTPGIFDFKAGGMIAASGTTAHTAVSRLSLGTTKILTNNSATAITNATVASNTSAAGVLEYTVEVFDGTEVQYEVGSMAYGVTNKGGVFSGNTVTKFGNHQNATSGTLSVTFAISAANPAVISVNANSSLTPSTGYPRITYSLKNLGQQSVAYQ